ncbi:MAG: hypothetical protein E3K32_05670 [wastewater metagenome]|nr:hypothetical protein [Candidatus Loosdrechtia aerotolerans]
MVSSSWYRKHQKTIYIVMIFAMFVWGISYSAMEMIPKKPVGKIYGRKISQNEFADMYNRWQRLFFSQSRESITSVIWKQFLFLEEAKRMELVVTPEEIENGLQRLAFQIFGTEMNMDRFGLIQFLCNSFRLNQEQLERTLREALLVEKLESSIRSSIQMPTEEAWQRYSMENEQVKFNVLALKAKDFSRSINVTEDETRAFYEKRKNVTYNPESGQPGYKLPERVKIECLIARYDDMEKHVSVTEKEMKEYYEDNKEMQFKITGEEMSNDETVTEDNEKEEKETTDTGKNSEKKEVVTTYKPFHEVKGDIQKTLAKQKAIEKTHEVMNALDEQLYSTLDKAERLDFKDLARLHNGVTYEIPKSKKSGDELLTEDDVFELFPGSNQIVQAVTDRAKYESSIPYDFIEGTVIFRVIDKKPPAPASLEEVRDRVVNDLILEKGLLRAKEIAEKYVGATKAAPLNEVVEALESEYKNTDISVIETDYITRPARLFDKESKYIEALGEDRPNVAKKAFELKPDQLGIAVETSGEKACYIMELVDKKPADKNAFEKDKESVTKRYLYEKQETLLTEWQNDMNRHLEIYVRFQ